MTSSSELTEAAILQHRDAAIGQVRFAREYTQRLISDIPLDQWYVFPKDCPSNIAWQVGHLAVSQYGLMLFRQRGRAEGDLELMPGWLRKQFGRGTTPPKSAETAPRPEDLLSILNRIHDQSMQEASNLTAATLAEPADMPYAVYAMKLGALLFAPIHESIHIGQIGMIRRMLGNEPQR